MYTVLKDYTHELIEKKSRFIGYIFKINSEDEAIEHIQQLKKEHHKARHHCYAYTLNKTIVRSSDDGEPSGTAGVPILETIQKLKLDNVLVVVVRYFGGIKLGAGGLIRVYSNTTSQTIKEAGIAEVCQKTIAILSVDYALNDKFNYLLTTNNINIQNIDYDTQVHFHLIIDDYNQLVDLLDQQYFNQYQLQNLGETIVEVPI